MTRSSKYRVRTPGWGEGDNLAVARRHKYIKDHCRVGAPGGGQHLLQSYRANDDNGTDLGVWGTTK